MVMMSLVHLVKHEIQSLFCIYLSNDSYTDDECRKYFFNGHASFASLRQGAPLDFDCNLGARRCWGELNLVALLAALLTHTYTGLDSRTNLYSVCRSLLRPLFALNGDSEFSFFLITLKKTVFEKINVSGSHIPAALAQDRVALGNDALAAVQVCFFVQSKTTFI